jgi:hypothetical protein
MPRLLIVGLIHLMRTDLLLGKDLETRNKTTVIATQRHSKHASTTTELLLQRFLLDLCKGVILKKIGPTQLVVSSELSSARELYSSDDSAVVGYLLDGNDVSTEGVMHLETENLAILENPHNVINDINDEAFYAMSGRTKQSVYRKPNSPIHTANWPKQEGFILVFWRCSLQTLAGIVTISRVIFFFQFFSALPCKRHDSTSNEATTTLFHIPSNSLFTNHPTI